MSTDAQIARAQVGHALRHGMDVWRSALLLYVSGDIEGAAPLLDEAAQIIDLARSQLAKVIQQQTGDTR